MKIKVLFVAAALLLAVSAHAQNQQDFSKVEIKTTKVSDKFFTLEGQGGTIGALVGPDGVFLVDTQFAPLTEKIVAAVKKISSTKSLRAHWNIVSRVPAISPEPPWLPESEPRGSMKPLNV